MSEIAVIISLTSLVIALTTVNTAYRYKTKNPKRRNKKGNHNG